jgi:hypothetical protein
MNVAMMQPAFMPWQGFYELIIRADIFIFLDDFQFSVQSYHQRNRLFVNAGQVDWYNVPVERSSFKMPLNRAIINESIPWRTKALTRMQLNYCKAPYYQEVFPRIEDWLLTRCSSLAEQNITLILAICKLLGIEREFRMSSQFPTASQRSERVLELLRWCGATKYYSARGSFTYMMNDGIFPVPDIAVLFQNYAPRPYRQVGSPSTFIPYLSILDAILNIGPQNTLELIRTGTDRWNTWDEMLQSAATTSHAGEEV